MRCAPLIVFVRVPEDGKCYVSAELFSFEGKEKMVILFIPLLFVKSFFVSWQVIIFFPGNQLATKIKHASF